MTAAIENQLMFGARVCGEGYLPAAGEREDAALCTTNPP